jgi:hypothetical protein
MRELPPSKTQPKLYSRRARKGVVDFQLPVLQYNNTRRQQSLDGNRYAVNNDALGDALTVTSETLRGIAIMQSPPAKTTPSRVAVSPIASEVSHFASYSA